jgi:cyd operon protein YbgT
MWYFTWILGLGLACAFSILNAMWLEVEDDTAAARRNAADAPAE